MNFTAVFNELTENTHGLQLEHNAKDNEEAAELAHKLLKVLGSILNAEAFPKIWFITFVHYHKSALNTLDQIGVTLFNELKPNNEKLANGALFLDNLYKLWLSTLSQRFDSDALTIMILPPQKRRVVWNHAGDVSKEGVNAS